MISPPSFTIYVVCCLSSHFSEYFTPRPMKKPAEAEVVQSSSLVQFRLRLRLRLGLQFRCNIDASQLKMKLKANLWLNKLSRVGVGGWQDFQQWVVKTMIAGTAISTIIEGTIVPTMIAGTKKFVGSCSNKSCWTSGSNNNC